MCRVRALTHLQKVKPHMDAFAVQSNLRCRWPLAAHAALHGMPGDCLSTWFGPVNSSAWQLSRLSKLSIRPRLTPSAWSLATDAVFMHSQFPPLPSSLLYCPFLSRGQYLIACVHLFPGSRFRSAIPAPMQGLHLSMRENARSVVFLHVVVTSRQRNRRRSTRRRELELRVRVHPGERVHREF